MPIGRRNRVSLSGRGRPSCNPTPYNPIRCNPLEGRDIPLALVPKNQWDHDVFVLGRLSRESAIDHDSLHETAIGLGAGVPCNIPSMLMSSSTSGQWTQTPSPISSQWSR